MGTKLDMGRKIFSESQAAKTKELHRQFCYLKDDELITAMTRATWAKRMESCSCGARMLLHKRDTAAAQIATSSQQKWILIFDRGKYFRIGEQSAIDAGCELEIERGKALASDQVERLMTKFAWQGVDEQRADERKLFQ